jgi:hypothetical protein
MIHKPKLLLSLALFLILILIPAFFLLRNNATLPGGVEGVRGKGPSLPLTEALTPEETLAQDLALSAPRVLDLTTGKSLKCSPSNAWGWISRRGMKCARTRIAARSRFIFGQRTRP